MIMKKESPSGFDEPTALPESETQGEYWQRENRHWWEKNPMRYDWKEGIGFEEFSRDFYLEIDRRFFSDVKTYMPWKALPFDSLINYTDLYQKNVLEIGIGNGSHAQLLATHANSFYGIDITEYAVKSTSSRMKCFSLQSNILRMDAEKMGFADNTFDFIWTWGVIHHSSNTDQILKEMKRVLKPGGSAITMVYYKSIWSYYVMSIIRGMLRGDLLKTLSLHQTVQKYTDGAIARYYSINEWRSLVSKYFVVKDIRVYGSKADLVPLPGGTFKNYIMNIIPDRASRLFSNRLKLGTFLVSVVENHINKQPGIYIIPIKQAFDYV